jgi:alpha-L-fucosidase
MKDLLDNYQPDILYFDGTLPFKNIGMDIGAHFYNSNTRWNNGSFQAVLNLKTVPEGRRDSYSCVFNIERGVARDLEEHPWQTDSCIGAFYYKK